MAEISKIKLPSGTVYDIKDATARAAISGGTSFLGITTTPLTDGATTTPIVINGENVNAVNGGMAIYNNKEFVYSSADSKWHEFGDLTGLGALAQKDSASGSYTPQGTVTAPTFSGSAMTATGSFTPAGSIVVNETSGSGTTYTPAGTISVNAASGSGTSYTPEGNVAAPTISLSAAGATSSISPFGSAGTLASLSMTVSEENLIITWDAGTLPSAGTSVTVKTGDATYSATAPTFTGIEKKLAFSGTGKKLDFSGSSGSVSVSGTPEGTITQPTFSGSTATITVS